MEGTHEARTAATYPTFLLTDIQGSSALHEQFPDEMFNLMETHDDIIGQAIQEVGGEQFKHTGDGVWAVFDDPLNAVLAAVQIQKAVSSLKVAESEPVVIRIGVSSGQARRRRDDFFGPALNVTARLEGAASGRQILIGETTRQLIGSAAPDHLRFEDLGQHRFKGLEPLTVYQVTAPGLVSDFPEIGGKREAPVGNLPADLSSFLGRERELADVIELVDTSRITTLLGPGGIGKTRLSIKAAQSARAAFDDGKFLIDLSPVEPGQDVWPAFTAALLIPPVADATPRIQVLDRLKTSNALLIVDNCEHVLSNIAEAITEIAAGSHVRILATSRHVLGVPGEALYDLIPLRGAEGDDPSASPAVQLFVDRGKLINRLFDPTPADLTKVAKICQALDHLPLAIEIAAANLRRLDLHEIHERAMDPLALKASRHKRIIGRQQTMRETLEWSYALLDDVYTDILDMLCIFSGNFIEETAADLCMSLGVDEDDFVDAVDELLDSSLLSRDPSSPNRYRVLQTVRAFGRARLENQGRLGQVGEAHSRTCARRVASLCIDFDSADERRAATTLLGELPDMRAAFDRAVEHNLELAAELTAPLFLFNYIHRGAEYGNWPARLVSKAGADALADAPIIFAAAAARALHGDGKQDEASSYLQRGLTAIEGGANSSQGWLDGVGGQVCYWSDDYQASVEHHLRAAAEAAESDNLSCRVISLSLASVSTAKTKNMELADQLLEEVAAAGQAARSPSAIGYGHFARGMIEARRDPKLALHEFEAAKEWANLGGNRQGANRVYRTIADLKAAYAEPDEALEIHAQALLNFPERGDTIHAWSCIESLLKPLSDLGRHDEVAILAGALTNSPINADRTSQRIVEAAAERLGQHEYDEAYNYGSDFGLTKTRQYVAESYLSMTPQPPNS